MRDVLFVFFFSSRRRHTRFDCDWSSDVCSSDLAPNGLDAIELADELEPDAVVIDLHMPLVGGVTAVARLRRDHPNLCLISLTGDPDPELHEAVTEAGGDAVLLKGDLVDARVERPAAGTAATRS